MVISGFMDIGWELSRKSTSSFAMSMNGCLSFDGARAQSVLAQSVGEGHTYSAATVVHLGLLLHAILDVVGTHSRAKLVVLGFEGGEGAHHLYMSRRSPTLGGEELADVILSEGWAIVCLCGVGGENGADLNTSCRRRLR